jgi:hypothetical protein
MLRSKFPEQGFEHGCRRQYSDDASMLVDDQAWSTISLLELPERTVRRKLLWEEEWWPGELRQQRPLASQRSTRHFFDRNDSNDIVNGSRPTTRDSLRSNARSTSRRSV